MSEEHIFKIDMSGCNGLLTPPVPVPKTTTTKETTCPLPGRFQPKMYKQYKMTYNTKQPQTSFDDVTIDVIIEPELDIEIATVPKEETSVHVECGEGELTQALTWIKSQLTVLKQEDKALLETFLEIRAKMNALRSNALLSDIVNGNSNSASDPSINDSSSSVDATREFRASSLLAEDDYLGEFRCRSVSMLSPRTSAMLQVPQNPNIRRVAADSEEFL